MVRGIMRYSLAEGVRLQSGDILEAGDKTLAEFEFADGAGLAMGPRTRLLAMALPRDKPAPGDFYVTQGAVKLSGVKQATRLRVVTPLFTLQPSDGVAVLLLDAGEGSVFIESGEARLSAPGTGRDAAALRLKSGEFYSARAGQKGSVAGRPAPAFIGALPKAFLDPLPSRMARYKERPVQPKALRVVEYAEVETWLQAPLAIRRPMLKRFERRAANPEFRAALVANLKSHPEWDPILFPEKYLPKDDEAEAAKAAAAALPAGKR